MPSALPLSYCASETRARDPNRYLCALFAPAAIREAWFALFAFHAELRDIPNKVSEDMIGFIRFAWWREALDEMYAQQTPRQHPVVEAMANVIHAFHLPRAPLDTLSAAFEQNLLREDFADAAEIAAYCRDTCGALFLLCAHVAGEEPSEAWQQTGTAWALVEKASAFPATDAMKEELIQQAAGGIEKAMKELSDKRSLLKPFLRTATWYVKRVRAGKIISGPQVRVLLALRLWITS